MSRKNKTYIKPPRSKLLFLPIGIFCCLLPSSPCLPFHPESTTRQRIPYKLIESWPVSKWEQSSLRSSATSSIYISFNCVYLELERQILYWRKLLSPEEHLAVKNHVHISVVYYLPAYIIPLANAAAQWWISINFALMHTPSNIYAGVWHWDFWVVLPQIPTCSLLGCVK